MTHTPESVRALLQSEDYGDRLRAVNQLRELDPETAFEMVQSAAVDSNARVRYAAVSQIATLGQNEPAQVASMLRTLLKTDPDPDVQAAAADTIGALRLTEAYEDLETLYHQTSEWLVQFSIVAALGELGDPRAFDLLQTALDAGNELISTAAIGALGELQDDRALPLLLAHTESADWQVRHRLVHALSHFSQPEARAALQALTQDGSPIVAEAATHHLNA
ncbi:phycobilisome degradation protein NblB [Pseudanabaena sp. FACHB-2040]|uniref:phycobilisome degradation protein NblB n=1 Tax=Pseudanabaena sp. FACHB-2040 TaxID=2692859 RepID=UPI001688296F|nr:HEAT repeat domain-containing protein [Pseudanabaena sp. FACHB-2040]MBD0268411.1 HEAT repeat domain-containing protein [Cyanobacteria bacterium Co-bin8]MBD2260376.1 HEAT repeat domain-containing protein [Pseudanabaena sp. FACHB-2040]